MLTAFLHQSDTYAEFRCLHATPHAMHRQATVPYYR